MPLRLVASGSPHLASAGVNCGRLAEATMTRNQRPVEINMSGIPVNGVGGLGLVAVAFLMTVVFPEAWWLVVIGALGGTVLGAVLVFARQHHVPSGPSGDDPT